MSPRADGDVPLLPDYRGACLSAVLPAVLNRFDGLPPAWLPAPVQQAEKVVLLVLDGLGWEQLQQRRALAPRLAAMAGGPITSVAPSTTAAALTCIATGRTPAETGIVGYRIRTGEHDVLNLLRWTVAGQDARDSVPPVDLQPVPPFCGTTPVVVTRAEFASSGFTTAHLRGGRLRGWRLASTLGVEVQAALDSGEPFVYAYYDGIDRVAHQYGFGPYYDAELRAVDALVGDLSDRLGPGAALVVTADHGQVQVDRRPLVLPDDLLADLELISGEGRFRWLHPRPGRLADVLGAARELYDDVAWVRTRSEMVAEGWFGGPLAPVVEARLGEVALVAREPVAFLDPADTGESALICRHGSLTPAEMWVPLLACAR